MNIYGFLKGLNVCKKFNLFHMYLIYYYHVRISIGFYFSHQRHFIYLHGRHILHLYPYRTDKIFFDLRHHILQFNKSILRKISFYKIFRENKYCILLLLFFFCLSFFLICKLVPDEPLCNQRTIPCS